MNVAIIDADLIGRKRHRFPNLVCMKISGYHKECGDNVILKTDYWSLDNYDKVYISKVFTDTEVPEIVFDIPTVQIGGTGFFYDKAPKLSKEIEHHKPDYRLYDKWVDEQIINNKKKPREFVYYKDYSIGFLTRGCFRKCEFCVNKNYNHVYQHSPLLEFYDATKPKICLLDDNFLGYPNWKELLKDLQETNKPFQFKQGLDERLLTDEKCELLFSSKYDGDYIFAFDNIEDMPIIEEKLKLIRKYTKKVPKFYCLCGFDRNNKYDIEFWKQDIIDLFKRIELLMKYQCLPYIMRYVRYNDSPYRGMYINIARWCNQPQFFKKKSLREFAIANKGGECVMRYLMDFEKDVPQSSYYIDMKFENF